MNVAYKHLDAKLRIAELTVGQWIGVLLGVGAAVGWGLYMSPFGPTLTLTSAVYVAVLPAGAAVLGNATELNPALLLRSALAWRQREGRFMPGPGASAHGYVVGGESRGEGAHTAADLDVGSLWGESA